MVGSKESVCWICDRSFASGKALGGHQKSHYSLLPLPWKTRGQQLHVAAPDQAIRSETWSSIGRRSKHHRAATTKDKDNTKVLSDKEAARYLLMLSTGKGLAKKLSRGKSVIVDAAPTTEVIELSSDSSVIDDDDDDDDEDYDYKKTFSCPYCKKMFGSAQGLGGHTRIHKRKAAEREPEHEPVHIPSVNSTKTYTIDLNKLPEPEPEDDESGDFI